ncbi:MAG: pantoate--beta-alanine ligase [Actinobacteria bacterium]|nr:pantoate--beta-alanine ligase [Actinomycetota bacterium]MBM3713418.1 pantoate--beta-alanine ligase [Actinomycetota bacterium]
MEVIENIDEMFKVSRALKKSSETIGLVPTMGCLHKGHLSLLEIAKKECTKVIMSIFVNPTQFSPGEDYEKYPRDFKADYEIAKNAGVDYIFYPGAKDMYNKNFKTFINVEKLSEIMCGACRPGHFRGVCTVVLKLFNIICPDIAYFGQKDYQQLLIIRRMAEDLNLKITITGCPTIREDDGLAISSRNNYLSENERKNAVILFNCLKTALELLKKGGKDLKSTGKLIQKRFEKNKFVTKVEYFDFRDAENLDEIKDLNKYFKRKPRGSILIASAVWIGNTRLIDNIIFSFN